ncbi:cupin domain-containing protein [Nocardioides sp. CER19]|uniref:cupin domain-containing protein n=1 Tax=Nocardioides sp. CER19 TaxID=3038538 RepID=UPI00244BE14C|nr:cupin domain-containing protein [Nocardioides sp. CER19]MDH2416176.1 cupin domain-containing protein [Nocardioides sp. CER19]
MSRVLDLTSAVVTAPIDETSIVDGTPAAGSRALTALAGTEVGVWEMTPGTSVDVEDDEVFVVLSGSATITFTDGSKVDLTPGCAVRLHAGERTTWTVHETIRKIYVS